MPRVGGEEPAGVHVETEGRPVSVVHPVEALQQHLVDVVLGWRLVHAGNAGHVAALLEQRSCTVDHRTLKPVRLPSGIALNATVSVIDLMVGTECRMLEK